tara:strand:+ start:1973 stop:2743 length:771 start_codon:yes stop_codon:yes gene_type:complete
MTEKLGITASIVLFNEDLIELTKTVDCFLKISISKKLFLIDNTPTKRFKGVFNHTEIEYIASGKNIGFGAGHNTIINKIKELSDYHLILNPDVFFKTTVISTLIAELEKDSTIAMISPKVLFPDGSFQHSCRRYPTISELIARRFNLINPIFKTLIFKGVYGDMDLGKPFFAEYITGCFHLYNTRDFIKLKGFDRRYFLYMEDVDICKKIDDLGKKKLYYPNVAITHVLKQGSSKKFNLFLRHAYSAIKYFLKWGI